ncbi:MAG: mobilization protein [Flavisolibacter sp.]|nr:mobilization protein [Flavisolibacter sp.]MBD0284315.1 mobilization protein [Flavisolibacter sp.]MBD0295106.1 mobilization protein [Flavisolibacter sp.]MBD0349880.1 mobilization protein [Flavisolibacter sp.]
MEEIKPKETKPSCKGGRPKKEVRCDQKLTVMCTLLERKVIEAKAKAVLLTVSEYLRHMGLSGKIDRRQKVLPKEVLAFTATLNHMAANLNQIAKKRNSIDELNALERAELQYFSGQFQQLARDIKTYLQ